MIEKITTANAKLKLLSHAVEQSPVSIVITDTQGKIEYVNHKFTSISGFNFEEVIGKTPRILKSGKNSKKVYTDLWSSIIKGKTWQGELHNKKKNGDLYWEQVYITPIKDKTGVIINFLSHKEDITTRKAYEEKLHHQQYYDELTNFPNRLLVIDRLRQAIRRAKRSGKKVGVLNIDLDDFKKVNDSHGHEAGNQIIIEASQRLDACMRHEDTIAHLSGDEFQIIAPDLDSIIDLEQIAQKLLNSFSQSFLINTQEVFMTASIGATIYPDDGQRAEILMRNASATVHLAKDSGRDNIRFFTERLNKQAHDRILLGSQLRHAIDQDEFTLNYQPIIDLKTGRIGACEILLRWKNDDLGMVPPATFIPHAEDSGLINSIGEWVLRNACTQISTWQQAGMEQINFAINTSGRQYRETGFARRFINIINMFNLRPNSIEFEITESLLFDDAPELTQTLQEFVDAGINLTIDDFGTGYSSLSYLRRFPLKKLKIDRSFILGLDNEDGRALVKAITMVGHALSLKVVAEGVETQEQIDFLRQTPCDLIQGYYYSKPLSADAFSRYINL
jgi:diguanylate cyclase (GGDEF)-like protein/PAS domain S-box-containing protein